jgi:hypothetical protein
MKAETMLERRYTLSSSWPRHSFRAAAGGGEAQGENFPTGFVLWTPEPRSLGATLSHRMGEGLGVRVSSAVRGEEATYLAKAILNHAPSAHD